jgi:hypothetical protein
MTPAQRRRAGIATVLAAALGIYLIAPAFTAVHVEGFSAQIQSIALALGSVGIERHDTYQPALTEFIFYTRQGVSELLFLINRIFGYRGDAGFRALTVASLLAVLAASVRFAKVWGKADARLALAALLLTPGLIETGFFFNDNIVSAAFACAAMAALLPGAAVARYGSSGMLLGMAILCRLDAVFVLPFIVGLAASDAVSPRQLMRRGIAFAAGALLVGGLAAAYFGAMPLDALHIAREFSQLSKRWSGGMRFDSACYFIGVVMPLPVLIGVATVLRREALGRRFLYAATMVLYPLLFTLYAMNGGNEIRYLLPLLAPVIALHGAQGLRWLLHSLRDRAAAARWLAGAWIVLLAGAFLLPPSFIAVRDGPRALTGRLYMPFIWWRWQQASGQTMERVASVVAEAEAGAAPQSLLISTHWSDDFYLKLRLMEAGYADTPIASRYPDCGGFTIYRRGAHEILQVRLHNHWQIAPYQPQVVSALILTRAFACPVIRQQQRAIVSTYGDEFSTLNPRIFGMQESGYSQPLALPLIRDELRIFKHRLDGWNDDSCCVKKEGLFAWSHLERAELDAMLAAAAAIAGEAARSAGSTPESMYEGMHRRLQSRIRR